MKARGNRQPFAARAVRRTITAVAAVAAVLLAGEALADRCARPNEEQALRTRVLQSEMMVAALSCGERARYNAVVNRFQDQLSQRGRDLKGLFKRVYGRNGTSSLDRFVTALANDVSQRSLADTGRFCAEAAAMFDRLTTIDAPTFLTYADDRTVGTPFAIRACAQEVSQAQTGR